MKTLLITGLIIIIVMAIGILGVKIQQGRAQAAEQIISLQIDNANLRTLFDEQANDLFEREAKLQLTQQVYQNLLDNPIIEIREVEVPIEKVVEVERVVSRTDWRDFESLVEFAEWSENLSVLWITGVDVDCDDYSEFVWDMAYRDGYRMSEPLVRDGKYYGIRVAASTKPHIGGQVVIGGKYYYFEPNPLMYRLVFIANRD